MGQGTPLRCFKGHTVAVLQWLPPDSNYLVALGLLAQDVAPEPTFDYIGPIAGSGIVGIFLLLVIFRVKIMPTYVYDDAKAEWDRERQRLEDDILDLKNTLKSANDVYTQQVIPTLTRVLDAERELVDLRRDEQASRRSARGAKA